MLHLPADWTIFYESKVLKLYRKTQGPRSKLWSLQVNVLQTSSFCRARSSCLSFRDPEDGLGWWKSVFVLFLFPYILLLPGIENNYVLVLQSALFGLSSGNNLYKKPGVYTRKSFLILSFSFYKINVGSDQRWNSLTERTIR